MPADDLNTDLHASAAYRAHLVGVLARRAVARRAVIQSRPMHRATFYFTSYWFTAPPGGWSHWRA